MSCGTGQVTIITDGTDNPVYCGDTIKYLITVLDENGLPFTGTISAVVSELLLPVNGIGQPLVPPVSKHLSAGVTVLTGAVVETIFVEADTADLAGIVYMFVMHVDSPNFGHRAYVRRLKLTKIF